MSSIKKRLMSILMVLAVFSVSLSGIGAPATASVAAEQTKSIFENNTQLIKMLEDNHNELVKNFDKQAYLELRVPQSLHGIKKDRFSENAIDVANKLIAKGYDAYIIGGGTRDLIMGEASDDFDLTTNATIEQQQEIFGDDLHTHPGPEGRVFGYVNYPNERIDLATYQNIPKALKDQPGIPDFDPTVLTSDSVLFDSLQRDFTMNAIYYDMKTDELVDFHGGIYDIYKGIITPIYKANIAFTYNPEAAPRALRFKAKYGYKFSDELENEMRTNGEKVVQSIDSYQKMNQTMRMWGKGYSYNSFATMVDYKVLDEFFAPIKEVYNDAYISEVGSLIQRYESLSKDVDQQIDAQMYVACILWPVVEKGIKDSGLTFEDSMKKVLDKLEEDFQLTAYGYMYDNVVNDLGKLATEDGYFVEEYDARMSNIIYVKEKEITEKAITIKVSAKTLKKKSVSFRVLQKGYGTLTLTNKTTSKKLKSKLTFKGDKVTLKKKAPKGAYKFTIVSEADDNYKKTESKIVTLKVA